MHNVAHFRSILAGNCIFLHYIASFCSFLYWKSQYTTKKINKKDRKNTPKMNPNNGPKMAQKDLTMRSNRRQNDPEMMLKRCQIDRKTSQKWSIITPKWPILTHFWAIFTHFGLILAILNRFWLQKGSKRPKIVKNDVKTLKTHLDLHQSTQNTQNPLRILPDAPTCCTIS